MEIRAYDRIYLDQARQIMGDMMDYAVNTCDMEPDYFFDLFLVTGVAEQFGNGNPHYVAGKNGCEIVKEVIAASKLPVPTDEDVMYTDKSPEYWSGWALAYYQWYTGRTFDKIRRAVSIHDILLMYPPLHEADIHKFIEFMEEKWQCFYPDTNLKRLRTVAGLSQHELAVQSGVSARQIQLFEQRQRDINKTQAGNVAKLAKALGCGMENLLEI